MINKNKIYEGRVTDLDYKADGVVLFEDNYIYIKGALKGELINFKINKLNKGYGFGTLVKVIEPSGERVSDLNYLGSLNLMHLSFKEQLNFQKEVTTNTFSKALGIDVNVLDTVTDNKEFNYRNKVTFHVLYTEEITLGLYKENGKGLTRVDNLVIANEASNDLIKEINDSKILIDPRILKHVMIKNNENDELLVTLVSTKRSFKGKDLLVKLISRNKNVVGITLNINNDKNKILGERSYLLLGSEILSYKDLLITDKSFMQVNYGVMDLAFNLIKENIKGKNILDLYSGIGSIIYSVLDKTKKGTMVESNIDNIRLAKEIKEQNNIDNLEIIHDLSENHLDHDNVNTLILDPPRNGLFKDLVLNIKESNIERIIYLSCNLQTLIRDIKLLDDSYKVDKVYPIKMFPQTNAFETLVILSKN